MTIFLIDHARGKPRPSTVPPTPRAPICPRTHHTVAAGLVPAGGSSSGGAQVVECAGVQFGGFCPPMETAESSFSRDHERNDLEVTSWSLLFLSQILGLRGGLVGPVSLNGDTQLTFDQFFVSRGPGAPTFLDLGWCNRKLFSLNIIVLIPALDEFSSLLIEDL